MKRTLLLETKRARLWMVEAHVTYGRRCHARGAPLSYWPKFDSL